MRANTRIFQFSVQLASDGLKYLAKFISEYSDSMVEPTVQPMASSFLQMSTDRNMRMKYFDWHTIVNVGRVSDLHR